MPNIHGLYSLGEVALKLSVSSAWINKIQKRTGIVQKEGGKGKLCYFSEEEMEILKNVKLLRVLDYSLDDIKELYSQEKMMMEYIGIKADPEPKESKEKYIIHYPYGYSERVSMDPDGTCLCFKGAPEDGPDEIDGEKYQEMASRIKDTFREVSRRASQLQEDLNRFL